MNNEFLRPRENSCKWFNKMRVMRRRLFIERGDKTKFSQKSNWVNRFSNLMNRFKPYKTKQEGEKNRCKMERVKRYLNRLKMPRRRLIQFIKRMNRFRQGQRDWWIDSNRKWNDSYLNRFTVRMIRIIWNPRASCQFWHTHESIQALFESIH